MRRDQMLYEDIFAGLRGHGGLGGFNGPAKQAESKSEGPAGAWGHRSNIWSPGSGRQTFSQSDPHVFSTIDHPN